MQYRFSAPVSSFEDTQGLCGDIPLRKHRDSAKEDTGAVRAQKDWANLVKPINRYRGGLGPQYSFVSVTIPECLPERLEVLAYANEFAFLYDDEMESSHDEGKEARDSAADAETVAALGAKQIQSQILAEMMAIDPVRALTSMKAWAKFVAHASSEKRMQSFSNLSEYMPFRLMDAGMMMWFGMVTFGMALTIPDAETELCKELTAPIYAAMGLANDLISWQKERDAAAARFQDNGAQEETLDGQKKLESFEMQGLVNAIPILMREHSITESAAKYVCQAHIKDYVRRYEQIVKETRSNDKISRDLQTYVEALRYSHSGNYAWSLQCPRYHSDKSFNDEQETLFAAAPASVINVDARVEKANSGTSSSKEDQPQIHVGVVEVRAEDA